MKPQRITGGPNQVNVGFSDEDYKVLTAYTQAKGVRTVQDALRLMVKGAKDWVEKQKGPKPAITSVSAVQSPIAKPITDTDVERTITSDDDMRPPSVVKNADPELDDDGEELSIAEKLRRARTQPALNSAEPERFTSLKDEM